jgi:hypothetical protein
MLRSAVLVGIALAALSACGSDTTSDGSADDADASAATSLTIVVTASESAEPSTYELTCDPDGGDHPQATQACAAIANAGAGVFDPVPSDQACTSVYGGPQTATVEGTYDGEAVDATFSRENGCELDRWEQLGTTVFNVPLQ